MPEPSGTVVFMGAGASKAFGLPLTSEILPSIVNRLRPSSPQSLPLFKGPNQVELVAEFKRVFATLYPGLDLDRSRDDELPNITNVLSLIDHLILYEYPASRRFGKDTLTRARRLVERAMMEVLLDCDLSLVMEKLQDWQDYVPEVEQERMIDRRTMTPEQQRTLDAFLAWLNEKRKAGRLTLVTTNYDVALETRLFECPDVIQVPQSIDFGFEWRDPSAEAVLNARPPQPKISFYKLHGSLNWLRCDLCGQVYINPQEEIAYLSFSERQAWANTCECGWWPLRHLIVAPSMVRDVRDPHLLNVWRSATEALRTAKEWFIVGYSLPAEDLAIRSMLLRAFHAQGLLPGPGLLSERADRPSPKVTVVQRSEAARPEYAAMFREFNYLAGGLEQLVGSAEA